MTAVRLHRLHRLRAARDRGEPLGIVSLCSAHPLAIEAALRHARDRGADALIEATCNQVNHEGGYTGMTPVEFRRRVAAIADAVDFAPDRLVLGGDHLGPNPWRHLPAEQAMAHAERMIHAYVRAGYSKIHLDASMGCRDEPAAVSDAVAAGRAARLARVAEAAAVEAGLPGPTYVIGTEVPTPGGAHGALGQLAVTAPEAAIATVEANRVAFAAEGVSAAFENVRAVVVQPGVEFGNDDVAAYDPQASRALSAGLDSLPGLVYEAHSTDYQTRGALQALVVDGFAILKVGPAATFALREAFYGLEAIADELHGAPADHAGLRETLERAMLEDPSHWRAHYDGDARRLDYLRHFSYSDRLRYYWPREDVAAAVTCLLDRLGDRPLPQTLIRQYLGALAGDVDSGRLRSSPRQLLIGAVFRVLDDYAAACAGHAEARE